MDTERALALGRPVLIRDVVAYHPGRPDRCLCRGSGEVTFIFQGRRGTKLCQAAFGAFQAAVGDRVQAWKEQWQWKLGVSPEEWGLAQVFHAEVREFAWREEFRQRLSGHAGRG